MVAVGRTVEAARTPHGVGSVRIAVLHSTQLRLPQLPQRHRPHKLRIRAVESDLRTQVVERVRHVPAEAVGLRIRAAVNVPRSQVEASIPAVASVLHIEMIPHTLHGLVATLAGETWLTVAEEPPTEKSQLLD